MALWGGRFSSETRNDVAEYSESISFDQRLYKFDIAGSKAHVTMLAEQGIIPAETAGAIRAELDRIEQRIDSGDFRYDIAMEDIHMHIESALIDVLGAEGARVHSARSRNDQVALDVRLYLRSEVDFLIGELRHFQRALATKAAAHPRTVMCKGLPLTYNRDLQEDKVAIFDALDTGKRILRVYPPMVETMKLREANMLAAASDPALMATDIAEKLVELGVPFRTAHHRVGAFVKYCKEHQMALDKATLEEMRETIPEATPEFLTLFNPVESVAKRDIVGGTGFDQVAKQLDFWKKALEI